MTDFTIGGYEYRAARLSAMDQFHVSRRIAPLLPALIPVVLKLGQRKLSEDDAPPSDAEQAESLRSGIVAVLNSPELLQPLADALAHLSDADAEYIVTRCLAVVERKTDKGNYAAVMPKGVRIPMFEDLRDNFGAVMPVVIRVIVDNLKGFTTGFATNA